MSWKRFNKIDCFLGLYKSMGMFIKWGKAIWTKPHSKMYNSGMFCLFIGTLSVELGS